METSPHDLSRTVPTGETSLRRDSSMEKPLSPDDERFVSANPSIDATIVGHARNARESSCGTNLAGDISIVPPPPPPPNTYISNVQEAIHGGYGHDGYSQYINAADGLHVSPVLCNDSPSLLLPSGYAFSPEMAYGQYSPVATPLPSLYLDGQLYSPQQFSFSPSFYAQPAPPHVPSSVSLAPSDLLTLDSSDNLLLGPGSGYLVHFGPFGGGNVSGAEGSSSLTSPPAYPQTMGIFGSSEHQIGQISQHRPLPGYGIMSPSSVGRYPHGGSYQSSHFSGGSMSYSGGNERVQLSLDKSRRREREQDSIYISNDSLGFDRNRGPRAFKLKGKSTTEQGSSSGNNEDNLSSFRHQFDLVNRPDFVTDYKNAKFFVMKSFSEDNVHKSIKYSVWASTPHGNKKLDAAYHEAKKLESNCPIFLFFSVNASGQFCGVAEMVGAVDFEKDADYWQQDRWSGQFPVQWHVVKDVPNGRFRHILLENNDNKPVTHSRDSQEVKLEQGIEMLTIFMDHDSHTSILDDFDFYNRRERALRERKSKQHASLGNDPALLADESINPISDSFVPKAQFGGGDSNKSENQATAVSRSDLIASSPIKLTSASQLSNAESFNDGFFRALKLEDSSNNVMQATEMGGGHQDQSC
ncbi:hypothetical protein K2173_017711 [Erythroxylum novogranatense]|uniref:YTH domain-containing family protein n=1 Tax=Erythroxylum novogranatense TaxID=1862640 RepID=A0AAV8SMB8_9ROSI|nr:hypothetical protein K2173_017711 [Erythroxylum novogranatense]